MFDTEKLYLKTFTCPVCGTVFKATQVKKNATRALKRFDDLSATYSTINPTYYGMIVCGNCGYTAFASDFEELGALQKKAVKEQISDKWQKRTIKHTLELEDAIRIHTLGLFNYSVQKRPPSEIAKIAMRLAWFHREKGDEIKSRNFEKEALKFYKQAFMEENLDLDPENRTTIYYLIGEYSFRDENYRDAARWFREAIISNRSGKNMFIQRLAEDRMEAVREAYANMKTGDTIEEALDKEDAENAEKGAK